MSLPDNTTLRDMLTKATRAPWEYEYDTATESHRMWAGEGDQRGYFMEDTDALRQPDPDWQLAALAPELAAEVIRLREKLESLASFCESVSKRDASTVAAAKAIRRAIEGGH